MQISNRKNIIISADDFGMSERANRNILFLVSIGKIDRIAIMMSGSFSEKDLASITKSGVKLDIHLTLDSNTCADPKTPPLLSRSVKFLKNYMSGKYRRAVVAKKWEDQIKKFYEAIGKYPDGINSHEHVHFFPPFFKIVAELQNKFPIPYLRFGNKEILTQKNKVGKILKFLRNFNQTNFKKTAFTSSEKLVSLDWIQNLDGFLDNPPEGTIEIVCHPHRAEEFVLLKDNF